MFQMTDDLVSLYGGNVVVEVLMVPAPAGHVRKVRSLQQATVAPPVSPLEDDWFYIRGGEISKMYTCPRTNGFTKTLVRTNALLVRTFTNTNASI